MQSLVVRPEAFWDVNDVDEPFLSSEDYDFAFRLVEAGHRIDFVSQPLTRIRRGADSNISSRSWRVLRGHLKVVWNHRDPYRRYDGTAAVRRHMAKYLRIAGERRGGATGKTVATLGRLFEAL